MNIAEVFDEVSRKMQSDFDATRQALTHPGLKGSALEEVVRRFLRNYIPKSLDISSGVIIDTDGKQSRQLDIVISDTAKTPILFESGDVRVVPVECVYAVIEVKARLDTEELARVFENMKSVRALNKKAYYRETGQVILNHVTVYGREWEIWPIHYFVFAFDSIDLQILAARIDEIHGSEDYTESARIDCACVLNRGVICNLNLQGELAATPEPGSRLVARPSKRALLLFYALIVHLLNQARLPSFNFTEYMRTLSF